MTNLRAIELDHTDDDCMSSDGMDMPKLELSIKKLARASGCEATFLPGKEPGGHPVFRIVGTPDNLLAYVTGYCDGDKECAMEMVEEYSEEA